MNEANPTPAEAAAAKLKPVSLKDLYAAKKPYPVFQVAFEDHGSGGPPQIVKIEMSALNAMSLYVQLIALVPILRAMGVMRFWLVNHDATELLADCNLDAIGANLQQLFGQRIVLATQDMMDQLRGEKR